MIKKTSDNSKLRINIAQLQKGKYTIRRRSSWNVCIRLQKRLILLTVGPFIREKIGSRLIFSRINGPNVTALVQKRICNIFNKFVKQACGSFFGVRRSFPFSYASWNEFLFLGHGGSVVIFFRDMFYVPTNYHENCGEIRNILWK